MVTVTIAAPPLPTSVLQAPPFGLQARGVYSLSGTAQKGPLIFGSTVLVSALNPDLSSTGAVYLTTTSDSLGSFTVAGGVATNLVDILADGFYYDEVQGQLSSAPIKLRGFANLSVTANPTINMLTTIQTPRLKTLMGPGYNLTFQAAYTQSQNELLASFNINSTALGLGALSSFNINGTSDASSVMLAVSTLLVQMAYNNAQLASSSASGNYFNGNSPSTAAQLSLLLSEVAFELNTKGKVNSTAFTTGLSTASASVDSVGVATNLQAYYTGLGSSVTLPTFQDFIDVDGSGQLPHRVKVSPTAFSFQPATAYAPGATVTSNNITIAGLPAGTRAFVQLYVPWFDQYYGGPPGWNGGSSPTSPSCQTWPTIGNGTAALQTNGAYLSSLAYSFGGNNYNGNWGSSISTGIPLLSKNGVPLNAAPCNWMSSFSSYCYGYSTYGVPTGGTNASVVTSTVNGDVFTLSVIAGDYGSVATLLLQVGSVTATWAVTTALPNPTAFSIQATTVADPFSSASSGSITVAGLPQGVSIPALLPCMPTTPYPTATGYGSGYNSNNGRSYCNSGSYFSLVNAYLNNQLISNRTLQQFSNGIPFFNAVVGSAPTNLNGLPIGACQVLVKNGDSVSLSLAPPGLLNSTQSIGPSTSYSAWFNPGSGGYGMTQSIPITIGGVTAFWNVTVASPTIQVAIGPTTPGQQTTGTTAPSGQTCASVVYGSAYGSFGTSASLQVAIPFTISLTQGTTQSIRSVVAGIAPYGSTASIAWSALFTDNSGSPGSVLTNGNTTAFYGSNCGGQCGNAGLFGPVSQSVCNSAQYSGPSLAGPGSTSINTGCMDSYNNMLEVVFPNGGASATSGRYWLVTAFSSNSTLPRLQPSTTTPAFGNVSITPAGGVGWVPFPSTPYTKFTGNATTYTSTTYYTMCSPYLYIM